MKFKKALISCVALSAIVVFPNVATPSTQFEILPSLSITANAASTLVKEDYKPYHLKYNLYNNGNGVLTATITGCDDGIPSSFSTQASVSFNGKNYKITAIANKAFQNNAKIASVDMSKSTGLTTIGDAAFSACSQLATVKLPANLSAISNRCFDSCTVLTSCSIPSSITSIGTSAFRNCSKLSSSITIPSKVASIGADAFSGTKITSLNISGASALTTIYGSAFLNCPITGTLVIPSNLTTIETRAFEGTKINSLDCSNAKNALI